MNTTLCRAAIILWIAGMAVMAWFFVKGVTMPGSDGRTEILLAQAERDQILAEMRQFLKGVQGIIRALNEQNANGIETAARAVGMGMAVDVEPALMMKLPLPFKQMGMSVHRDFDGLADGVAQDETAPQTLRRLSTIMSRCTTCHDLYRFSVK
ncbi:MAG TPA: hypothetical protein VJ746_10220 [Nitrospira sp.]|nr:hypothetical protein [Nitrospira sp.]